MATVLLIGTLDTKGPETAYLRDRVAAHGCDALVLDSGILGEAQGISADFDRRAVAEAAGSTIEALRSAGSRGKAVEEMLKGVRKIALDLYHTGRIHGVAALGGAEGSVLAAAACKALPIGFPKLIVSPIASGHRKFAPFVGIKDVLVMHSVVDILGLNPVSRVIFDSAAAAIAGMSVAYAARQAADTAPQSAVRPAIAATMLGNTTRPLMRVRPAIEDAGYDFVIFHANGVGGAAMEALIREGYFAGIIDYTLSEVAGFIAGGFHNAGVERLDAAAQTGVPQLVIPGCLDFMVFGAKHEVPPQFQDRPMYYHNPEFTLVRLTPDEQIRAAQFVIDKLNAASGAVSVLLPLGGGSIMDIEGGAFWEPALNEQIRQMLQTGLRTSIRYQEIAAHINDDAFADATIHAMQDLMQQRNA
ncbi:MAG: Tm-1-like ATP-binding domain-containing protein [Anaerolineae bacterium]